MKRLVVTTALALALGLGFASAQNINRSLQGSQDPRGPVTLDVSNSVYFPNHINAFGNMTKTPTVSCGTAGANNPNLVAGSTDTAGTINNSATTCGLTFGSPFNAAPICVVSGGGFTGALGALSTAAMVTSTVSFQLTALGAGTQSLYYICIGNQ